MNYVRPPILEAAIEFSWEDERSLEELRSAIQASKISGFPEQRDTHQVDAMLDVESAEFSSEVKQTGFELRTKSGDQSLTISNSSFKYTQAAPYQGWQGFAPIAVDRLCDFSSSLGIIQLSGLSTRFVNRLDMPLDEDNRVDTSDYINVDIHGLYGDGPIRNVQMRVHKEIEGTDLSYWLTVAVLKSPMPDRAGLFLDIEVVSDRAGKMERSNLMSRLEELHVEKNNVFESTITDAARELFGGVLE